MALHDIKRELKRLNFKDKAVGPWMYGIKKDYLNEDFGTGALGICGHYDEELDVFDFCRDPECRRERLIKALKTGEALRTLEGNIIWAHGVVIKNM